MESLLRWSIANSTNHDDAPTDRPPVRREDLNPDIIDAILGRPDSELMKDDMAVARDTTKSEEERINALDHLEMLIEQIDNANNLEKLQLWEPLQSLLTSEATNDIKVQALWVIGTAMQNNPAAQDDYLTIKPLPALLSFLTASPDSSVEIRSKAIYALSGLLKHNAPALKQFDDLGVNGWIKLRDSLQDPNISVRRKAIFLFTSLLVPTYPVHNSQPPSNDPLLIQDAPPDSSSNPNATTASSSQSVNVLTPDRRPAPSNDPIHPNSHAAQLRDTTRSSTSSITLAAFRKYGILNAVISSVVNPLPQGEDGENIDADADYEEKALQLLYTYAGPCQGVFDAKHKKTLKSWIEGERNAAGNEEILLEKWNLTNVEYGILLERLT